MATKRKQQTVQFLFEASPENNITRCVISSTASNTFENYEEANRGDDSHVQIATDKVITLKESLNTFGNDEELNSFQDDSSARARWKIEEENDGEYMKTGEQTDQIYTDKGILQEHVGSKVARSSSINSHDNMMINTIPESEHISNGTTESSDLKTLNDSDQKEQNVCTTPGDLYNTNQSHQPKIQPAKTILSASLVYNKNHTNFHNTIQQSLLANPKDNDSKEQFPLIGDFNHLEARNESRKLSHDLGVKDKAIGCEMIDNFNAQFCDENESKYLHVIDCDMHEPVSGIRSFDYSENTHQSPKVIGKKGRDGFSEVYNGFNTTVQETDPNFLQDYNPGRQLPKLSNPRRLEGKQTNLCANIPSNINAADTVIENIEGDLYGRKQPESKVKNLIHNYERQVHENSSHQKLEEKHGDQLANILSTDTVQSPYTERRNITTKSHTNHVSHLNESYSLHELELGSEEIIHAPTTKTNNTGYRHSMTTESNTRHIPDSNAKHPPEIPGNKDLQSLEKTVSGSEDSKNISGPKGNSTGDIYSITKEVNTSFVHDSDTGKQSPNAMNTDAYKSKVRKDDQSSRSDYQFQACIDDSQVTRAHWFDIHSPLQQPSQKIQPPISKEDNTFTSPPSSEENSFTSSPSTVNFNTATGESFNEMQHKGWKSLGELDKIDQVQEYKLPEKLNKTTAYPTNEQEMTDGNNNLDTTYFSTIPRNHVVQNAQRFNLGYNDNGTETLSFDAKTVHRMPFFNNNNHVLNIHSTTNSGFDNNSVQTHKSSSDKGAKQSPLLTRKKYVPNMYNTSNAQMNSSGFDINSTTTLSPDYNTANKSPSLRKYVPTMCNTNGAKKVSSDFKKNGDKTLSPGDETSNHSPLLTRKHEKLSGITQRVNNYSDSLSPSPRRKNEKMFEYVQNVNNSSGSMVFQQTSRDHKINNLKDNDKNLSSSLTALETLDQSPMKRSPKIKNLVNIEYYDINSDEELNSKIRRRPRTKSLNHDEKTTEYPAPRREFKSSGDLRSVGLSHEEINAERKETERASRVGLSSVSSTRTHGKYTELYMDSIAYDRHPHGKIPNSDRSLFHKPSPSTNVSSHDRNLNEYEIHSQGPQIPNYDTAMDRAKHYSTVCHYEGSSLVLDRSVEQPAHKGSHVRSNNATNLPIDLKQNHSRMKRLLSPLHNSGGNTSKIDNNMKHHGKHVEGNTPKSTVKRLPSPLQKFSRIAKKTDNSTKHYANDIRDNTPKSIVYPIEDLNASQGKYNIAKAEEEWKKKYGRLPYNNKDPLHKSSDKEFGRLFQRKTATQSSSKDTGLTMNTSSLEGTMADISSSSLFSPSRNEDRDGKRSSKISPSKEFSTTLNQLSSYVLSGYKIDHTQTSLPDNQEHTRQDVTVKHKQYYLDGEGDLSHILDDPNESPKLSMLVHAIIRLREVYSIQPYTKPQTPEHPINLGNPQLRDAIQNKPMSVVKDLILANKSVDINIRGQSGNAALHRAAMEGDIDAIRILINHGANVNIRDRNGFQPVHHALGCHHYKAAMFLMDCGTDLVCYTSKRIQEFVNVKAIAKQYLRQTLKTPL